MKYSKELYVVDFRVSKQGIEMWVLPAKINMEVGAMAVRAFLGDCEFFTDPSSDYIHAGGRISTLNDSGDGLYANAHLTRKDNPGGMVTVRYDEGQTGNDLLYNLNLVERMLLGGCCDE